MLMIAIFLLKMSKSLFVKKLATVYSASFDNVPIGFSSIFLAHFSDFMKEMKRLKETELRDVVNMLDESVQKLDMIALEIFILFMIKVNLEIVIKLWR